MTPFDDDVREPPEHCDDSARVPTAEERALLARASWSTAELVECAFLARRLLAALDAGRRT